MDQARRLYTDAGPAGMQGLERVGDPDGLVKAIAMEDGRRLKAEAIRLLRAGHVERSTETLRRVHLCFSFVDREGLADATADVDAAVLMVRWFASGDATVAAADAALETGASEGAINLLQEAKSFYNRAQSCYDDLVDQVTSLLQARPCDNEAVNMAIELQDNINGIYDSRKDGQRVKRVEFRLDCLAADASLENLAQIVDCEQFEDAHTLLSSAASVYGRSEDHARLSKVNRITLLIRLIEKGKLALDAACFIEAKRTLSDASHERSVLVFEKPVSMHPPDCKLLRDGERGAESLVLSRVRVADDVHGVNAFKLLEQGGHAAAEVEAISSSTRLEWWTRQVGSAAPGAAERAGEIEGVICRAKELRVKKANAVGMAKAEKSSLEERGEKRQGDLDGAAQAFRTAAKLFPTAGLGARAFDARIEAKQTQAEKLVLNVEGFHSGADLEASVESLESAQALLLEASAEMGEVVEEQRHELEDLSLDDIGINDAPPSRLRRQLKEIQDFCSRFAGDSIVRGVVPAMDMQDYDKALCPIRKADGQNGAARLARWLTSAVTSYKVRTGAGPASVPAEEAAVSPEELLVERETLDGARLRAKAAAALEKEKDPAKAQRLLSREVAAMEWAGANPSMAGATAVARDIKNFEYRKTGDATCRDLVCHLRDGEIERTKEKLAEALDMYHQGVAFQEVAETRAILSCVDREKDVCSNIVSAVTTGDPAKAVTTPTAASHQLGGKNDDDDNFRELLCQGSEGEVASTTLSQAQHMAHETRRANAVGDHVTNNDGVECSLGSHASPSDSWSGKPAPDIKKEHMENLQNLK